MTGFEEFVNFYAQTQGNHTRTGHQEREEHPNKKCKNVFLTSGVVVAHENEGEERVERLKNSKLVKVTTNTFPTSFPRCLGNMTWTSTKLAGEFGEHRLEATH